MGSKKRRAPRRSLQFSQKGRFPVGELAKQRAALRKEYLLKSKELNSLRKRLDRLQENSDKVRECVEELNRSDATPPTQK